MAAIHRGSGDRKSLGSSANGIHCSSGNFCSYGSATRSSLSLDAAGLGLHEILVKPSDGLVEGLLLGKPLHLHVRIAAHREAVLDLRVQVDLVGVAGFLENLLGPVALLGGEDGVGLGGGDGQRPGDGRELVLVDEGRVREISDIDPILVVPDDVLDHMCKPRISPSSFTTASVPWLQSSSPRRRAS